MENYWGRLWSEEVNHEAAEWITKEEEANCQLSSMPDFLITNEDISAALKKTQNWKAPGVDGIQNYWWKRFTSVHEQLATAFNQMVLEPNNAPQFLTQGVTYLLFKSGSRENPQNYRPITCLPTIYKLLTSILADNIYKFLDSNSVLAKEQKGCVKRSMGCKEQLVIDSFILAQSRKRSRNLSIAYIDYQKAFDSVPHSWLIHILKIYKINPTIVHFMEEIMKNWMTKVKLSSVTTCNIPIRRGIYQGDSLSPLWFCLALNPLSRILNETQFGYKLEVKQRSSQITHLMYMDDIKVFANSPDNLHSLLKVIQFYSSDIKMSFGIDKCATVHISRGKFTTGENYHLSNESFIKCLESDENYKYLGFLQNHNFDHPHLKNCFQDKYEKRLVSLLKTHLNAKNLITAINTWAVSVLTYTFGIVNWSQTDLDTMNRKTRTLMTKFRKHHAKGCVDRLYLPRSEGGRGLLDISNLCHSQITTLKNYFKSSQDPIHQLIVHLDKDYTPLKLAGNIELPVINIKSRTENWLAKPLYGQFPNSLLDANVDKEQSTLWLKHGRLHAETEGFMFAIQDQAIPTRYYRKQILHENVDGLCRACHSSNETIHHIISGCQVLAPLDYTCRHNQVAKIIHQQLAKTFNLVETVPPYYKYEPPPVLENRNATLYWDKQIITDKTIDHNKPDIILMDKSKRITYVIDIAVPSTNNLKKTEETKIQKYRALKTEILKIWKQNEVIVVPLVISATGIISKALKGYLARLPLKRNVLPEMQKSVILQTCHLTRKFLS